MWFDRYKDFSLSRYSLWVFRYQPNMYLALNFRFNENNADFNSVRSLSCQLFGIKKRAH